MKHNGDSLNDSGTGPSRPPIRVLYSASEIDRRRRELAAQISRDFAGEDLFMICVLKGSMPFFVDLARDLSIPVRFGYIGVTSYGDDTESSRQVELTSDLRESITGRHVLLVEDIVDTGITASQVMKMLRVRGPARLRLAALLDKPSRREVPVEIHYRGFEVDNHFVVGYGLDHAQLYRNLPYIGVLHDTAQREEGERVCHEEANDSP